MSCNWENATEQQKKVIEKIERKRFKERKREVTIICIMFLVCTCIVIGISHVFSIETIENEILGYDSDDPPKYSGTWYWYYEPEVEINENFDMSPYDPEKETLEEYELRTLMAISKVSVNDVDERIEKQEEEEQEFYREQEEEIEQAHVEAVKRANRTYGPYYVWAVLIWALVGTAAMLIYYIRLREFCTWKIRVSKGVCVGKEKTVYRGRNYRNNQYCMDIRLTDGEIIEDVEVKSDAYDKIEYEENVIMIKMENSICDIDRVYPEKVFSEVTYEL